MSEHIAAPLFEGLSGKQYDELAGIGVDRFYKRGEIIFAEGDEGIGFYVLISGKVKVFKLSPEGKEQILQVFGEGEPFGEGESDFPPMPRRSSKAGSFSFPGRPLSSSSRKTLPWL